MGGEKLMEGGHMEAAASGMEVGSTSAVAWMEFHTRVVHERQSAASGSKPVN